MISALPAFLVASVISPQVGSIERARSAPRVIEEPTVVQDFSWYPFELRPPFVSDAVEADHEDVIYAGNALFTVDDELDMPQPLVKPLRRGEVFEPGYFVVHFEAGVRREDKQMLDQVSGPVRRADGSNLARWYVPNNSLVVWVANEAVYEVLETSLRVDWIGRYQPAWKLDQTIGSFRLQNPERLGRAFYRLNVDLIPGHNPAAAAASIANVGGLVRDHVYIRGDREYDVSFLVVDASPETVVRIAAIEGVRMIQETGDGKAEHDLSGGGKLQNRTLAADDDDDSPIVTSSTYPLWLQHDLQGQGQLIGVVDSSIDWQNTAVSGCNFGYPDTNIDNWGLALPNLSKVLLTSVGAGGVNLKIPRAAILGGATLNGNGNNQHGMGAAGAALGDFYGNNDQKWWEHDVDNWESWAPTEYSGLVGPGIAHEAQLFFAPTDNDNGAFRWEFAGEFEANMNTALDQMAAAGTCTTNHSVGIVESSNTYTQTSVVHDTNGYDHQDMLQCMAAGNDGAGSNQLTSQAVVKNGMAVGASDDVLQPENRVSFSSTGPRFDGGLKPDVMAPGNDEFPRAGGVNSLLMLPDSGTGSCAYQYTAGTSFAAPIIAGAGALVHQYFEEGRYGGNTPILDASASLMKAALINAGHRLTGANLGNGQYPNDYQGWGEPNLSDVLDFGTGSRRLVAYDVPSAAGFTGSGNGNDNYDVTVNGSGQRLRVTLVWTDEPGSTGSGKKLINDLDLRVVSPGGATYRGNVINGTTGVSTTGGSADTLNNVENVILANPQTGTWTVTVDPGAGNYASGQGYALVITGDVSEGGTAPDPPVADFSGSPTTGVAPLNVNFSDLSTGTVTSWSWTFGDGGTSSAQNPSHDYTTPGTYAVSLTATGPGGSDVETKTGYVTVNDAPPTAEFSGSPTSGTVPLNVSFTDLSSGNVTSWSWTFGDGGTSSSQNPSHTYSATGTYTVSLTVTGPGGSDGETKTGYVTVSEPAPTAEFSGTPTSGLTPLNVSFSDLSSGNVTGWSWTFGDGGTSSAQNPSHTYTSAGTYTVSLTASGPGGSDVETKSGYITVSDAPTPPTADFSGTPTSGDAPLNVSFTDLSTGTVTGWSWTFGDGGTSSAQHPSHTYTSAGTYTVTLTASGPGGSDGETKVGYVNVSDPPAAPTAEFSGTPTNGEAPLNVNFTDLSSGSVTSWSWTFGDGGSSTAQNPSHTYTSAGTYTVTLTATGPGGSDAETKTDYITVTSPPGGTELYYLSFTSNTSIPGVGTVADEDVVTYDPATGQWAHYFDGSDVGVTADVNALHVLDDGTLVLSFNVATSIPGLVGGPAGTAIDDSDLVLFNFTQSGSSTAGSFQFIFDGSDVGMSSNGEDIDAVYEFPDGGLAISMTGNPSVGVSGDADEDILLFVATQYGATTVGTWSMYWDGSDVGFGGSGSDDVSAVAFDNGVDMLFSTVGTYVGAGSTGADEDVSRFSGTFGTSTSGAAALVLDLSALGISTSEDVDGLHYRP